RALTYQAMLQAGITQPDRRSFTWPTWAGVGGRHPGMRQLPKPTPWNLRRFSEAPPPRRAINKIKNAVLRLEWDVVPYDEHVANRGLAGIPARQLSGYPTD